MISIKNNNNYIDEYLYEIFPISIINFSEEKLHRLLSSYIEFLKIIDTKFKILIRNYKFDKEEYINKHMATSSNIKNLDIYSSYIEDLKKKIDKEKIYDVRAYLCIVCSKENKQNIEEGIAKLKDAGINIKRLQGNEILKVLYNSINKL